MITNQTIIKLKGCTKEQRATVKAILLKNYMELLDAIERDADYCTVDAYWKDFTPSSKPIIGAELFISKYGDDTTDNDVLSVIGRILLKKTILAEAAIGDEIKAPLSIFRDDLKLYICHIDKNLVYFNTSPNTPKSQCESAFAEDLELASDYGIR